jgi:hypothetical protein
MLSTRRLTTSSSAPSPTHALYYFWMGFCWLSLVSCSSSSLSNTKDSGENPPEAAVPTVSPLLVVSSGDANALTPQHRGFEYPSDLSPHLTQILMPDTPALPPYVVRHAHEPASKAGPIPEARWNPPTTWKGLPLELRGTASTSDVRPPYPTERFSPYAVFVAAQPPKASLPPAVGITTRAPDPSLPPPLPPLSRFTSERLGFDDPTTDTHHAFLLTSPPRLTLPPVPFEKPEIPDPYVFGEHIRPQLPPQLEPGRRPDTIPPPRLSLP